MYNTKSINRNIVECKGEIASTVPPVGIAY